MLPTEAPRCSSSWGYSGLWAGLSYKNIRPFSPDIPFASKDLFIPTIHRICGLPHNGWSFVVFLSLIYRGVCCNSGPDSGEKVCTSYTSFIHHLKAKVFPSYLMSAQKAVRRNSSRMSKYLTMWGSSGSLKVFSLHIRPGMQLFIQHILWIKLLLYTKLLKHFWASITTENKGKESLLAILSIYGNVVAPHSSHTDILYFPSLPSLLNFW